MEFIRTLLELGFHSLRRLRQSMNPKLKIYPYSKLGSYARPIPEANTACFKETELKGSSRKSGFSSSDRVMVA